MSEIEVHNVHSIPAYEGPHAIEGIRFRPARQALDVTAWGMNVMEIDGGCTGYPAHDHKHDKQEEVYVVLKGQAVLHADDREFPLDEGAIVRVPPQVHRTFSTETGVTLLALGGTPGAPYSVTPGM